MFVPSRVFDTLLEPGKAMGIDKEEEHSHGSTHSTKSCEKNRNSWIDWSQLILGFK